jgi:hypothetical protein
MDTERTPSLLLVPSLAPSGPIYLTGEDQLRLTTWNRIATPGVSLEGSLLNKDGVVVPFSEPQTPNTDRTAKTTDKWPGEGWLLNFAVRATAAAFPVGGCFARVEVVRGRSSSVQQVTTLVEGYVGLGQRVVWPNGVSQGCLEGGGSLRAITGTDPAAGAEVSETVPTGARWELIAFAVNLVTDATVANRTPVLILDDGTNVYYKSSTSGNETASLTWEHYWVQGIAFIFDGTRHISQLSIPPNNRLGAGHRIRTTTLGLVAGDNYAAPQMLVREWIEP